MWARFVEESEIDPEIYLVFTNNKASWVELQRDLSVDDIYDLIEIIEVESTLDKAQHADEKARQQKQRG